MPWISFDTSMKTTPNILAPLIKIHQRGLSFIHVKSVLLHPKIKHSPSILPVVVFSPPLGNKSLELYDC